MFQHFAFAFLRCNGKHIINFFWPYPLGNILITSFDNANIVCSNLLPNLHQINWHIFIQKHVQNPGSAISDLNLLRSNLEYVKLKKHVKNPQKGVHKKVHLGVRV